MMAQLLQADFVREHLGGIMTAVVKEPSFDFSGAAPQKLVAVDGLSIQVMASNLSARSCSFAESVIKSVTVDDSADILARYASTFSGGDLRVSTSGLDSGMVTGPSCDFGVIALQVVVTVNGVFESCDSQQPK